MARPCVLLKVDQPRCNLALKFVCVSAMGLLEEDDEGSVIMSQSLNDSGERIPWHFCQGALKRAFVPLACAAGGPDPGWAVLTVSIFSI